MSYLKDLAIVLWSSFLSNVSVMSKSQLFLCWPIAHKKLMVSCFLYLQKKGPICDLIKHRNQINYSYWKKTSLCIMCNEIVILWLNTLPREIFFLGKLYPLFLAIIHIGALLHLQYLDTLFFQTLQKKNLSNLSIFLTLSESNLESKWLFFIE